VLSQHSVPGIFTALLHGDLLLRGWRYCQSSAGRTYAKAMGADLIIAVNLNCAGSHQKLDAEATKNRDHWAAEQNWDNPQEKRITRSSQVQSESSEASKLAASSHFLKNPRDRLSDLGGTNSINR